MIQRGQLHQSPHSLHRVLCQQYSNYTCILSNAPAIFCRYIIVRKYEPLFINRTVAASCQNFRVLPSCSHALFQRGQLRTATLASAFVSSSYASNTLTTHAYSVMLPLYFVDTLLCVNMNRFLLIALLVPAVKMSAFYSHALQSRVLHRGYALIQRGQLHQSPHSLHRVLCQQYSNYTCILSNAPAIFCRYIIVRKYEPLFINRTVGASCQNFRVLHSAYALIQYADNAYCYTSLRIRFIVLCQQYSDYTCILSNAPAIFCAYIIVRK